MCFGKETWLQVTGISDKNVHNNIDPLYESSAYFSAVCKRKSDRVCEKYINPNEEPGRTKFSEIVKMPDNKGRAAKTVVINRIKKAITEATAGDKIVISLEGHGTPAPYKKATSCIYINSGEVICDDELKDLLAQIKPGVKVAVIADACYSGGFVSLSSPNVCFVAKSDQRYRSYNYFGESFWSNVFTGKVNKLSDVSKLNQFRGAEYRLGSFVMQANGCESIRRQISAKLGKTAFRDTLNCAQGDNVTDADKSVRGFNFLNAVATESALCAEKNNQTYIKLCEHWKKAKDYLLNSPTLIAAIQNNRDLQYALKAQKTEINSTRAQADARTYQKFVESADGGLSDTIAKAKIKQDKFASQLDAETPEEIRQDLQFLRECLLDPEDRVLADPVIEKLETDKQRPQFTNQQTEQAKACEADFSL